MKSTDTIAPVIIRPLSRIVGLLAVAMLSACAPATDSLVVRDALSRETAPGATSGVIYLQIAAGQQSDRLIGVSSEVSERAEVHESSMEGGVMRMRPVPALDIAAGATVTFEPGGLHVMLLNLRHELRAGSAFEAKLEFERAGTVPVTVAVRSLD